MTIIIDSIHSATQKRYSASLPDYLFYTYCSKIHDTNIKSTIPGIEEPMSAAESMKWAKSLIREKMKSLSKPNSDGVQRWLFSEMVIPHLKFNGEFFKDTLEEERLA